MNKVTGFIFLDKEEGITSFIAAAKMRRIFSEKKAGHTGTLDPMATGVLPIALGGATRFIELIPSHDKAYRATFILGKTTDTLDITGAVLSENEVKAKKEDVEKALQKFRGEIMQLPPMYSAIKKNGVRLYELARQGIEIERESRKVTIYSLELVSSDEWKNEYVIDVECSSGTYIRSLISDIGEELLCGAVMTSLRRTKANGVSIEKCHTAEQLQKLKDEGRLSEALTRVDEFLSYPKLKVSAPQAKRFSNGGALDTNRFGGKKEPGLYLVYSPEDEFLGIGEIDSEITELSPKRVYRGE
ncbi:MAG: tRNA pseudouridine(55) synthase TruB [Clostridia bacterium]|nr:tRNA pseudouridine(55) synthase TruB [Clostridia bacterium]MBR2417830.1 tRNA pseudouridine(55) synthase TruB [Clostridia bacterium]